MLQTNKIKQFAHMLNPSNIVLQRNQPISSTNIHRLFIAIYVGNTPNQLRQVRLQMNLSNLLELIKSSIQSENFLLDRFDKDSKWKSLMQDKLAKKILSVNQMVWAYYLVCLCKTSVENPEVKDDSVENNDFLNEVKSLKNKKELTVKLEGF